MLKTIRAHYSKGRIELVEPVSLEEGAEIEVTISIIPPAKGAFNATQATAGAWRALLDCEEFEDTVYKSRLLRTRPEIAL